MKLVAYLADTPESPAEDEVRLEEEIADEDYITRGKDYYEEQLKQRLVSDFGKGVSAEGRRWEWSPQIKGRVKTEVTVEPRIPAITLEEEIRRGRKSAEELSRDRERIWEETGVKYETYTRLVNQYSRGEITLKEFYERL